MSNTCFLGHVCPMCVQNAFKKSGFERLKRGNLNSKQVEEKNGGGRWIRTIEAFRSRFTVCPLWPLGNPTIGASKESRTPVTSLEGWCTTVYAILANIMSFA